MTTPERDTPEHTHPDVGPAWREIVQSAGDCASIHGLALEQLIDMQRGRTPGREAAQ
ncbi:hypothetical protein FIU94_16285 [Sulfitobacter sp. THAF37]|uniref:hypothetical protein n=1 Tax=Sulfitobacter sp. THAF37 TaxID=2587855 RepID=UPI0012A9AC39|nr:hypothetical protein [Sulfitobacter sp. THAF37]QFT60389.1 hypothetical protein FIU94_16285 [Sulfitobacter sp. THAF37]